MTTDATDPGAVGRRGVGAGIPVLVAGVATFALELLGPRRLAPDVGTSLTVMTVSIAVVLGGAALGAAAAGRLGDGGHGRRTEGLALVLAALGIGLGVLLAHPAIEALAPEGSPATRALVGALALLLVPGVALGAVPILAARRAVAARPGEPGVLGRLSALGTTGGCLGLWLVAEGLLPRTGVTAALAGLAVALALVGVVLLARARTRPPDEPTRPDLARQPASANPVRLLGPALAAGFVGFAILSLEVTAVRRVAARVGSSLEAWTAVLSVVLVATAAGAARARDVAEAARRPSTAGTLALGSLPLLALLDGRVLDAVLGLEFLAPTARVFLAAALAYGPALVALGAVAPRLSRVATSGVEAVGGRLAVVSVAGTAGALLGTLATAPLLLPLVRTEGALAVVGLAAAAATALARPAPRGLAFLVVLPPLAILGLAVARPEAIRSHASTGRDTPTDRTVFDEDGPYARVRVVSYDDPEREGGRLLRLAIDARVQGTFAPADDVVARSPYIGVAAAVVDRAIEGVAAPRLLVLGGGAYLLPRTFLAAHPDGRVAAVELDPAVVRAARACFGLVDDPRLELVEADARTALSNDPRLAGRYDAVFLDAFGDVSIPWTLATVEFARETRRHLVPGGVFVANVIDAFEPGRLVAALRATWLEAFAHVDVFGATRADGRLVNFVLVASDTPRRWGGLARASEDGPVACERYGPDELDALARRTGARPLVDDFAPVEHLVRETVARTLGR